jgi:lactate dehydrogenase-like 2-hydroxyacid dehydrogenase
MNDVQKSYGLTDSHALNMLVTREFHAELIDPLDAAYTLRHAYDKDERKTFLQQHGAEIGAVLTSGMVGLSADEIALMPNLKVVQTFAVGYETVDTAAAKKQGVIVCNTAGSNADCVADHAMGMMVAVTRKFVDFNNTAKAGTWDDVGNSTPMVSGKKLGIVGLGAIGKTLARRATGFDMTIGYRNRKPAKDVPYQYFDSVAALADWCDYLVTCTPGGAETNHMINADILKRIGPAGYYINVARGSVADTDAIVAALNAGTIAGAGLDVLESEPDVPESVRTAPNLMLTTHGAGRSFELEGRRVDLIRTNIENVLTGKPALTPVPEMSF